MEYEDGTVEAQTLLLPHQKKRIQLRNTIAEDCVTMKFDRLVAGGVVTVNTTSQKPGDKVLVKYHGGDTMAVEDSGRGMGVSGWVPASGGASKDPHVGLLHGEICRVCEFKKKGRESGAVRIKNEETQAALDQQRRGPRPGALLHED